ncbi:hypothetical protein FRC04_004735 [Tulasnella sp. 424]|nr:hypothetical protein FRC04_004735 [Tulasnella sp. 424]
MLQGSTAESNNARGKLYPMEIFNDSPSTSSSTSYAFNPSKQVSNEPIATQVDVDGPGDMHVDPDSDDSASSDAGSWRSAESNFDDDEERPQTPEPPPHDEQEEELYVDPTLEAAMSQLSVEALARLQQKSDQGEVDGDPMDEDDGMSIAETEIDETNVESLNSSFSAATDASGTTTSSADTIEYEDSLTQASTLKPPPRFKLGIPVWDDSTSSRRRTPSSLKDLAPTHCFVIAHSEKHAAWFDKHGVPWSAQWQIAVLLSKPESNRKLKWEDISEKKVQALSGTNSVVGPKVLSVLFDRVRRRASGLLTQGRNPYVELDREEAALDKGTYETLGLSPSSEDDTELAMGTWWGGRVEQRAVMVNLGVDEPRKSMCSGANRSPKVRWAIRLHQQEMRGKSCRFARKFGSRRFIQLKIPELRSQAERDSLQEELLKPFLLHGRIFRAFSTHDGTVRLVETDENVGRVPRPEFGDSRRSSFLDFLDWFNPLEQNAHQIISKWSARFTLGLSTSQPVLLFSSENMEFIADIVSDQRTGSLESKHIMTDGCGRMNRAALRLIQKQKGLQTMPTALQGRIAGAKGLWILDDDDQTDSPRIWISASQVKIRYTPEELDRDPSRRIFDLLRIGQVKTPARLSAQPITNFAHNGVPHTVFSELLQESLKETIDHLFEEWKTDDAVSMWDLVFNKGGVGHIRKGRYAKVFERIFGNFRDTEETDESSWTSDDFGSPVDLDDSNTGPDPNSGWPTELAEQIVETFQAGFTPSKCAYLASMMKSYLKIEVKRMIQGCHIPVKRSAEAFAAPDFSGTLKPGEVFFRSSQQCGLVDDPVMADGIARGDMIIFRYPIRTPSDGRLVRAVDYPKLRNFTDVLLFSTLGERSGASILAGGDYDGDTIHMITEPRLVTMFKNSSLNFADPPEGFGGYVETVACRGGEVLAGLSSLNEAEQLRELQLILLEPVTREKYYGRYSTMTDISTYIYGYDSDMTHYLSYMFSNELDAEKSGIHVLKDVWENDSSHFRKWNQPACLRKPGDEGKKKEPQRPSHLGPFVLDALNPFARDQEKRYLDLIDKLDEDADTDCDPALVAPVDQADRRARRLKGTGQDGMWDELERLKRFVEGNRKSWARLFTEQRAVRSSQGSIRLVRTNSSTSQDSTGPDTSDFFQLPKKTQIQKKREIADEFWNGFDGIDRLVYFSEDEARRVMASYAYHHAHDHARRTAAANGRRKGSLEYAFVVAFRTLAELKGKHHGQYSISVDPFQNFMIPRKNVRDEGRMELD